MMKLHGAPTATAAAAATGNLMGEPANAGPRSGTRFHVFPVGPMCSLRRVLLMWMVPLFLLVGAASAVFSYWSYSKMVGEFMDDQMAQLGQSIVMQDEHMMPPPLTAERIHKWGSYAVQVYGTDGTLVASSWPTLAAPLQQQPGFADLRTGGSSWRVYST